jgi:hypothetical protein
MYYYHMNSFGLICEEYMIMYNIFTHAFNQINLYHPFKMLILKKPVFHLRCLPMKVNTFVYF